MNEPNHQPADNGSVLHIAVAAVMLILAGLSVMVLDDSRLEVVTSAQASVAQQR